MSLKINISHRNALEQNGATNFGTRCCFLCATEKFHF